MQGLDPGMFLVLRSSCPHLTLLFCYLRWTLKPRYDDDVRAVVCVLVEGEKRREHGMRGDALFKGRSRARKTVLSST